MRYFSFPISPFRYLKSVFPTVEEYLLLDVLSNSDNNVQKAAERLVKMGYVKRDTPSNITVKIVSQIESTFKASMLALKYSSSGHKVLLFFRAILEFVYLLKTAQQWKKNQGVLLQKRT